MMVIVMTMDTVEEAVDLQARKTTCNKLWHPRSRAVAVLAATQDRHQKHGASSNQDLAAWMYWTPSATVKMTPPGLTTMLNASLRQLKVLLQTSIMTMT